MPEAATRRTIAHERWLPPALWAISLALSLLIPDAANGETAQVVTLAAILAALLAIRVVRVPDDPDERFSPAWAVWFVAYSVVVWLACLANPLFGFLGWSGYLLCVWIFPARWLWTGVLLTACVTALSQLGGDVRLEPGSVGIYLGLIVANATIAGLAVWYSWTNERQNEERLVALTAAEAANARLEAALAENRALQEQLVLGAREAGIGDERARLAREIHDTIAQGLSGIVRQLEAADGAPQDEVGRRIGTARELARESLSEARRSVQALRPEPLEEARLPDAIATVVADWSRLHGVAAAATTSGDPSRLHPEIDVALLRTAQEALANVAKHARAGRVGVTLTYMGDEVTLDVRDDGVGFDPAALEATAVPATTMRDGAAARTAAGRGAPGAGRSATVAARDGGYGLVAMRERLAAVGGRLAVESAPGEGAALSATVPAVEPR